MRLQSFQGRESICSVLDTVHTKYPDTNRIGINDCFNKNYKIYQKWGTKNYLDTWNNWKPFTILEMLVCCIRLSLVTNTVVFDWKKRGGGRNFQCALADYAHTVCLFCLLHKQWLQQKDTSGVGLRHLIPRCFYMLRLQAPEYKKKKKYSEKLLEQ